VTLQVCLATLHRPYLTTLQKPRLAMRLLRSFAVTSRWRKSSRSIVTALEAIILSGLATSFVRLVIALSTSLATGFLPPYG
jgi:hypothetical protein